MVVKLKPFMIKCQDCGWHKMVVPKSDVLMDDDCLEVCPVCNSKSIFKEDVGFLQLLLIKLTNI